MSPSLPPMASFRGPPGVSSSTSSGSVATSSPLYTHSPVPSHNQPTPTGQTGDTLGKALASVSSVLGDDGDSSKVVRHTKQLRHHSLDEVVLFTMIH